MIDAQALLTQAEATNRKRDADERALGFASPGDGPPDETVRTAIEALHAGLRAEDWTCIAEAADILGNLVRYKPWQEQAQ